MLPSRLWKIFKGLKRVGVMGMNSRNACYVFRSDSGMPFRSVDDKLATKQVCLAHGISVPKTYAVVDRQGDIERLPRMLEGLTDFVIKPRMGSRGRGILVIRRRNHDVFETADGESYRIADLQEHVAGILSGLYSLTDAPDGAMIEQCIVSDPAFKRLGMEGVPDVRVIVFRSTPVMAMLRLPTVISGGRANLHQGAVGLGVDLDTGETSGGVWKDRAVDRHPDTGQPLVGFQVPRWKTILQATVGLSQCLKIDYLGVDFVLDARHGPVVLEANARPGLAIQVANRQGLLQRLQIIDRQTRERSEEERPATLSDASVSPVAGDRRQVKIVEVHDARIGA